MAFLKVAEEPLLTEKMSGIDSRLFRVPLPRCAWGDGGVRRTEITDPDSWKVK